MTLYQNEQVHPWHWQIHKWLLYREKSYLSTWRFFSRCTYISRCLQKKQTSIALHNPCQVFLCTVASNIGSITYSIKYMWSFLFRDYHLWPRGWILFLFFLRNRWWRISSNVHHAQLELLNHPTWCFNELQITTLIFHASSKWLNNTWTELPQERTSSGRKSFIVAPSRTTTLCTRNLSLQWWSDSISIGACIVTAPMPTLHCQFESN